MVRRFRWSLCFALFCIILFFLFSVLFHLELWHFVMIQYPNNVALCPRMFRTKYFLFLLYQTERPEFGKERVILYYMNVNSAIGDLWILHIESINKQFRLQSCGLRIADSLFTILQWPMLHSHFKIRLNTEYIESFWFGIPISVTILTF